MKLIEKRSQIRRDFVGLYECEGCKEQKIEIQCYDDRTFHDKVMPNRKCKKCGKSSNDLGVEIERVETKYSDYEVV